MSELKTLPYIPRISHNNPVLPISDSGEGISGIVLADLEWRENSAILWCYRGIYRILPCAIIHDTWRVYTDRQKLAELGRLAGMPEVEMCFIWNQTISLEEYFSQLDAPDDYADDGGTPG